LLKLLQIQPDKDVAITYIQQSEFKYVRALGAIYLRLVGSARDVYTYLEPLLSDWRKLRCRSTTQWSILHVDEFVDELLAQDSVFGIALPYLTKRSVLERTAKLPERDSAIAEPGQTAPPTALAGVDNQMQSKGVSFDFPGCSDISLSINDSKKLRAELGLPPLRE
jgi:hypothetical protein